MATLSVLKFDTADGAQQMLTKLQELQKAQLISIQDAAYVTWPEGAKKPKTEQLRNLTGTGALDGAFWGMLFGLLFFVPVLGLAMGAAMGALAGHFSDYGIDDKFINDMRSKIKEGTSALFLLSTGAVLDKIAAAVKGMQFELVSTSLSKEEEATLRAAFGDEPAPAAPAAVAATAALAAAAEPAEPAEPAASAAPEESHAPAALAATAALAGAAVMAESDEPVAPAESAAPAALAATAALAGSDEPAAPVEPVAPVLLAASVEPAATEATETEAASTTNLADIEGIGAVYAEKLKGAGVDSVEALLAQGAKPAGRKKIAADSGITEKLVLTWVNHADLFRVEGVNLGYAELLEASGVDTVVELGKRNPANLLAKMSAVNAASHRVHSLPSIGEVEGWVASGKTLPRVVEY